MTKRSKLLERLQKNWLVFLGGAITVLLFLVLLLCTFYGDKIYVKIFPEVPVQRMKTVRYSEENYISIPKSAVTEESTIYVVTSEQGFSRTIHRIREVSIEYIKNEETPSEYLTATRLPTGCFIVTEASLAGNLKDGDKVLIRK